MRKRIVAVVTVFLVFCLISVEAKAVTNTYIGYGATWTSGSATLNIRDANTGKTTTGILTVKRSNTLSFANFCKAPSTWYCSLSVPGENYHNLRLNQETVTTVLDSTKEYSIMNFSLSYTQHGNYKYSRNFSEGDGNSRMNFNNYTASNVGASSTVSTEMVDTDTERTINWQVCATQFGVVTSYNYRCQGAYSTIEYSRPSYKVTFVDDTGKIINEQTVLRGDNAKMPEPPIKNGYYFAGWDKFLLNIKENLTVSPKWVSKDGSNPPVAGEDALSVHTDLYDEAQTFYVPEVDTELINPNIE